MKEISPDELKVLQMDILQAVDDFCKKNGIAYSLACGSLLGAVRHKGYIPWDDDIDIYLLREDYERLVTLFPSVYNGRYRLISLEREKRWERPYAKAYDDATIVRENTTENISIGVNIDVYPIDDVPDDEAEWKRYDKQRRFLQHVFSMKLIRFSRNRSMLKNVFLFVTKLLLCVVPRRAFARFLSTFAQKHNGKGYHSVFECVQGMLQKHKFDKSLFASMRRVPFEDRSFMAFEDYDAYLRNGYGDYMQLPPEEKRVAHHDFIAFWK